ncbi:hypothetical protein Tco_0943571 [Tanacetum coccineum]
MGDENPIRTLGDYSKPSHEGYRNTIELPVGNNVVPLRSDTIRRTIDQSAGDKLRDRNAKESWALLEDLALYDNESWNDPRDFAKPVKAIALPQDVPSTSDRLVPMTLSIAWKILSKPLLNTHPCVPMKRETRNAQPMFMARSAAVTIHPKKKSESRDDKPEENGEEEKNNLENIHANPFAPPDPSIPFITKIVLKLNLFFESLGLVPQSSNTKLVCTKGDDNDVMYIEIVKTDDDSHKEEPKAGEQEVGYFDIIPTRIKLAYHKYLMCGPIPSIFLRNPIITEGCLSNLKIP